jgi:hypothetical protein
MDVVFLIDATGSMSASIKTAHDRATIIANQLRKQSPDVDFTFGSVCYRDPVDVQSDEHQVHGLDGNIETLVAFFETVRASGGGDCPEDWVGAYELALNEINWREGGKTIIHMADAPAHGSIFGGPGHEEEAQKLPPLIVQLAKRQIVISAMDISGGGSASFAKCKQIYDEAQGPGYDIQQFISPVQQCREQRIDGPIPCPSRDPSPCSSRAPSMGKQLSMQTMQACQQALDTRYG